MTRKALRVAAFVRSWVSDRHGAISSRSAVPMTVGEFGEFGESVECETCGAWRVPERDASGALRFFCPNGCGE